MVLTFAAALVTNRLTVEDLTIWRDEISTWRKGLSLPQQQISLVIGNKGDIPNNPRQVSTLHLQRLVSRWPRSEYVEVRYRFPCHSTRFNTT